VEKWASRRNRNRDIGEWKIIERNLAKWSLGKMDMKIENKISINSGGYNT
jgi:hypothetical protein